MAVARLLFTISALLSIISLQVVYGGIVCEKLPVEVCAFSVSTSGARCVLQKSILSHGYVQYECQTSEVIAATRNAPLIETEECMNVCGVERMTVGTSTDSLAEPGFTKKLCSPSCYNCPNIIDLYFNLAARTGVYLPRLCEDHRSGDRRLIMLPSTEMPPMRKVVPVVIPPMPNMPPIPTMPPVVIPPMPNMPPIPTMPPVVIPPMPTMPPIPPMPPVVIPPIPKIPPAVTPAIPEMPPLPKIGVPPSKP